MKPPDRRAYVAASGLFSSPVVDECQGCGVDSHGIGRQHVAKISRSEVSPISASQCFQVDTSRSAAPEHRPFTLPQSAGPAPI